MLDSARNVAEARGIGEVEGVLDVARGVVEGGGERVEAVELRLDLGAVGHRETDLAQDAAQLFAHERERVPGARAAVRRRQSGVDRRAELGGDLVFLDPAQSGVEQCLQLGLGIVDQTAERGPLVLGHGAHLLHQQGEPAIGADQAGLGRFEFGAGADRTEFGPRVREQGGELVLHKDGSTTGAPGAQQRKH